MASEYNPEGGEWQECPHCGDFWYVDDVEIIIEYFGPEEKAEITEELDYDDEEFCCSNCGKVFFEEWRNETDPSEEDVVAQFRDGFTAAEWATLTPTDKRSYYNDFTDGLCKSGEISSFMYENMSGHPEG